jgi:hypothetical protein
MLSKRRLIETFAVSTCTAVGTGSIVARTGVTIGGTLEAILQSSPRTIDSVTKKEEDDKLASEEKLFDMVLDGVSQKTTCRNCELLPEECFCSRHTQQIYVEVGTHFM